MKIFKPYFADQAAVNDCIAFMAEGYYKNVRWFSDASCAIPKQSGTKNLDGLRAELRCRNDVVSNAAADYFGEDVSKLARAKIRSVGQLELQSLFQ